MKRYIIAAEEIEWSDVLNADIIGYMCRYFALEKVDEMKEGFNSMTKSYIKELKQDDQATATALDWKYGDTIDYYETVQKQGETFLNTWKGLYFRRSTSRNFLTHDYVKNFVRASLLLEVAGDLEKARIATELAKQVKRDMTTSSEPTTSTEVIVIAEEILTAEIVDIVKEDTL